MRFPCLTLLLALAAWAGGMGCSREQSGATQSTTGTNAVPTPTPELADFKALLPREGGPAGYTGSQDCRACHEDQFNSWHRSYHRTMTQYASPETVQADFHNVVLTNANLRFRLRQQEKQLWVRMERIGTEGADGTAVEALETQIGLVTGSHHMQVFWVPGDEGNTQVGFPFTWLIPEKRWVPRNSTFIRPPESEHRAEIWNVVCSRCHATGIEPRVDSVNHTVDTRAAELGISCEACHGPGERHVTARRLAGLQAKPSAETLREEIVHPGKLPADRSAQVCGFCHSMKWIGGQEPWRQQGFRFRPGDDLNATTPVIRPSSADRVPGLREYLARNPELLGDFFWSDGMMRVSGREYNGLIESPCHAGGQFSCVSCHSLHESDPDDQLARNRTDNRACLQCHEAYRAPEALTAHTHHASASSGSQCYNCHMPHTTYGVLKAIRSHQISSPAVATELATGRPNACNLCHLDKTLAWTAEHLAAWYRQPQPTLDDSFKQVADSLRLALTGDAGQRALIAWHFSWPAAVQTAGTNWITPFLGLLLDDPYAAVRCIAERSLKNNGLQPPAGYDFSTDPASRNGAFAVVWDAWERSLGQDFAPPRLISDMLLQPGNRAATQAQLERWLGRRNERAMRLRE